MNLPKGTEHFVTDLHGEYEAFEHILRNASGVIKIKVDETFGHSLRGSEKKELCTLIYYPIGKLKIVKQQEQDLNDWYKITLMRLVQICANVSSKYTRSKVRKALPKEYSYIIQELLHESKGNQENKYDYILAIIETIISTERADHFITTMCNLIQRLTIDSLHIVGDIYDRGTGAHDILDTLCSYHNYDIQWGNHDLVWMGAAAGSEACVANVLRMCFRYGSFKTLEEGYGINLLPLVTFAMDVYGDDECTLFKPKGNTEEPLTLKQVKLIAQMHKAIAIMQFKIEHKIIARREEFEMADRDLLHLIDYANGTITIDGETYPLKDNKFPTIDPNNPYELSEEEYEVITKLTNSFKNSVSLHKHMECFYNHGALYLVRNSNLLFHGSVPLNDDGSFKSMTIMGEKFKGKALFDKIDKLVRSAYYESEKDTLKLYGLDFIWYLWCGPVSPPFDKEKMATFERYFIADSKLHKEKKGNYYYLKDDKELCVRILKEFGIEENPSHIINGHIPVKATQGESPIKAGGKLLVIDGGYSKAYQDETGIAGYTLIYNSHGLILIQHEPFESKQIAIEQGVDIISEKSVVEFTESRKLVRDTDIGRELATQIEDLKQLLTAYRNGVLRHN